MRNQLIKEQVNECAKLCQINAVPEILEVSDAILPHLHKLKSKEEELG